MKNLYIENGYDRLVKIHKFENGRCFCGNADCQMVGKHPVNSGWQHTKPVTVAQASRWVGGYGIVLRDSGLLVVDVDDKDGKNGHETWLGLVDEIPALADCSFVVRSGSGGNSKHYYFKIPQGLRLRTVIADYPDIDFKSSGFVLGVGSPHSSGSTYDAVFGDPSTIGDAPDELLALIAHVEVERRDVDFELDDTDIGQLLTFIDPDILEYHDWMRVGMGVHTATMGGGFDLWDQWSSQDAGRYKSAGMRSKWRSFNGNSVGVGTLVMLAKEGGWTPPERELEEEDIGIDISTLPKSLLGLNKRRAAIQEVADDGFDDPDMMLDAIEESHADDDSDFNLERPPGMMGEIVDWINSRCYYPRRNLAVGAAFAGVAAVCGLRHGPSDLMRHNKLSMMAMFVAGSATGKEAIREALGALIKAAGIGVVIKERLRSEIEMTKNLVEHQVCVYSIDEIGDLLEALTSKNRASYNATTIGVLMSHLTSNSIGFDGSTKREFKQEHINTLKKLKAAFNAGDMDQSEYDRAYDKEQARYNRIKEGIENHLVGFYGFTTPASYSSFIDTKTVQDGLLSRALVYTEDDDNPKPNPDHVDGKLALPPRIAARLLELGPVPYMDQYDDEVKFEGEKSILHCDQECLDYYREVTDYFIELASQDEFAGKESIFRRVHQHVVVLATCMGVLDGRMTMEHLEWAFAFAEHNTMAKLRIICAELAGERGKHQERLMEYVRSKGSASEAKIINRFASKSLEESRIKRELRILVKNKLLIEGINNRGNPTYSIP